MKSLDEWLVAIALGLERGDLSPSAAGRSLRAIAVDVAAALEELRVLRRPHERDEPSGGEDA